MKDDLVVQRLLICQKIKANLIFHVMTALKCPPHDKKKQKKLAISRLTVRALHQKQIEPIIITDPCLHWIQ